jgi:putative transposase
MAFVAEDEAMSVKRQCELLEVSRSSFYHRSADAVGKKAKDELLMREMDRIYLEEPTYGSRRLLDELKKMGHDVGRDRVRRFMREMGLEPIYCRPRLSQPGKGHKIYPYLLRNLEIEDPGHVWCSDITYIPLVKGQEVLRS